MQGIDLFFKKNDDPLNYLKHDMITRVDYSFQVREFASLRRKLCWEEKSSFG